MPWVLLILMWSENGGVTTTTIGFKNEMLCNVSRTSVLVNAPLSIDRTGVTIKAICLPIGAP